MKLPSAPVSSRFADTVREVAEQHHCGRGLICLVLVLLVLSVLSGANFTQDTRVYTAGEVAEQNIVAERDLQIEDNQATQAKREQIISRQPLILDLSSEAADQLQKHIHILFNIINDAGGGQAEKEKNRLAEELGLTILPEQYQEYANPVVQSYVMNTLLPKAKNRLNDGVLSHLQDMRSARSGIVIRNLDSGTEILRMDSTTLTDVQGLITELSVDIKAEKSLNYQARKAVNELFGAFLTPSLTYNSEATRTHAVVAAKAIEPVYYYLRRGETVARKGDKISREQQIKIQAIHMNLKDFIEIKTSAGIFILSLLIALGFLIAPSGKLGTSLTCKDLILTSLLLLVFCSGAKGLYILGLHFQYPGILPKFSYGYPVGAVVGLAAMVFAARRYCAFGLLMALFCTIMFRGNPALFFFHFLSGMIATWLVSKAQNRQDVVWSLIPHVLFHIVLWFGVTLLEGNALIEYPGEIAAVLVNSISTLLLLFAVSPVLELIFGCTTRFRLMELMNLEQPLLQELMLTMPGTYHHSLLVANLVEAGAKAVGANSLLCKVAALFHDIGKISYPGYFIENQFDGVNKHDKLAPSMSALVLCSHVKKGIEFAQANRLGQEIIDIIGQHHGTRLIAYFYQRAVDMGENPRREDYSYPGPRPQSREAAIVMLADVVEASTRTLTEPTPARIAGHIDKIMKNIFAEGQLDESELTFTDLHKLSSTFNRILTGLFHQRIAYPEMKEKNDLKQQEKEQRSEQISPATLPLQPVETKK